MKDEKMRKTIENLEKMTQLTQLSKISNFECGMLKCLNNINDNLDDIRLIFRDIKNHLMESKK